MKKFLYHLFLPHHTNNHRAKLLHNVSIFLVIVFLFGVSLFISWGKNAHPSILGVSYSITQSELLDSVNRARAEYNLEPLTLNTQLETAAHQKATHMFSNNYWAHFAPDGTTPWQFITGSGYNYIDAGENLAKGFTTSDEVVRAWLASPTHRDNILSSKYHDIGFAIVPGTLQGEETVLVVQMFGSVSQIASQPSTTEVAVLPEAAVAEEPAAQPVVETQPQQPLIMGDTSYERETAVNLRDIPRSIIVVVFVVFLVILLLDIVIIERRKIPRIVGHNIDHVIIITLFVLFVLLYKSGAVM